MDFFNPARGQWGAYPPPPVPPASGKVPVPGTDRRFGLAQRQARAGGNESRGNTRGLPAFLRKDPIAFPLPFAGAEPVRIRAGMSHPGVCRSSNGTGRDATLRAAFSPPNPSLAGLLLCR